MDGRRPAFGRAHRTRPTGRLARRPLCRARVAIRRGGIAWIMLYLELDDRRSHRRTVVPNSGRCLRMRLCTGVHNLPCSVGALTSQQQLLRDLSCRRIEPDRRLRVHLRCALLLDGEYRSASSGRNHPAAPHGCVPQSGSADATGQGKRLKLVPSSHCAAALAAPAPVPTSVDEAVAEVAVLAAGLLVAGLAELHAVRVISTQMAPSAAIIARVAGRLPGVCLLGFSAGGGLPVAVCADSLTVRGYRRGVAPVGIN
jgi:hypothetical protein